MTYRRIRSLARGVEVLRYLNTVKGAHPVDIGKELGLPRPTVHRILETLEELELVYQGAYSREFRLTPGVRRLAAGGDKFSDLRAAAWPVMRDLTAESVWPSDLAVFQNDAMLIIESTHRLSPISSEIGMVGQSRSMLVSPLGKAYLSHSSKKHRDMILARLRALAQPEDPIIGDSHAIDPVVEAGRRDGFICDDRPHESHASMAVPVRVDGKAVASLNIVWHVDDLTIQQARERLARPLLTARDRIEAQLRATKHENSAPVMSQVSACLYDDAYIRRTHAALRRLGRQDGLVSAPI